jgi:hypothetical protein
MLAALVLTAALLAGTAHAAHRWHRWSSPSYRRWTIAFLIALGILHLGFLGTSGCASPSADRS